MHEKNLTKQRHIGLLFGSFNPVHKGHIDLAQAILTLQSVDQVWLIVSPHNPHKDSATLAPFEHRVVMAELAVKLIPNILVSAIEGTLQIPSYTYQTLRVLRNQYPEYIFSIIGGSDVIESIFTWKESNEIVTYHDFFIRERTDKKQMQIPDGVRVTIIPGCYEISATTIRDQLGTQKSVDKLPQGVLQYIRDHKLYS